MSAPAERTGSHGRRADDSGVAVVEFAFVVPILLLLLMGIFEFGLAWRTRINLETSVGLASRQASNLGDQRTADFEALSSLMGSTTGSGAEITKVVIFEANASGDPIAAPCLTTSPSGSGSGVTGRCNIYGPTQLSNPGVTFATNFGPTLTTCGPSSWDRFWCPTARDADQGDPGGPDWLGVRITAERETITGLFGDTITINVNSVFRLEPDPT